VLQGPAWVGGMMARIQCSRRGRRVLTRLQGKVLAQEQEGDDEAKIRVQDEQGDGPAM
jgi:hypothetical protein